MSRISLNDWYKLSTNDQLNYLNSITSQDFPAAPRREITLSDGQTVSAPASPAIIQAFGGRTVTVNPNKIPFISTGLVSVFGTAIVTLDTPAQNFNIAYVGKSEGVKLKMFDSAGTEIVGQTSYSPSGQALSTATVTASDTIIYSVQIIAASPISITSVGTLPDLTKTQSPVITNPNQQSPTVTTAPDTSANVNLLEFLKFSKSSTNVAFYKDLVKAIPSEEVSVSNISDMITMKVKLVGTKGVSFNPNVFLLSPHDAVKVMINYDVAELNTLPEGRARITCTADVSVQSVMSPPISSDSDSGVIFPPSQHSTVVFNRQAWNNNSTNVIPDNSYNVAVKKLTDVVDTISWNDKAPSIVQWSGNVVFSKLIRFNVQNRGGFRISIDGVLIIDRWYEHDTMGIQPSEIAFPQGNNIGTHALTVEYFNKTFTDIVTPGLFNLTWDNL